MNENLEKNLFFNTLMTKYSKCYDAASSIDCCLFVAPSNRYLKFVNINESFIINHILIASKLLKSHYIPYKKCSIIDVEIENDNLVVQRDGEKEKDRIKIIGEETAYNENKSYKILIVEKPLIKIKINPSSLKEEPIQTIYFTFEECEKYLSTLSPTIIKEIKEKVDDLLKRYLILADYLEDAALKLKGLIDWSVARYSTGIVAKFDEEILVSSLECYILALAYDKVYPVLKSRFQSEEQELEDQLRKMEKEDIHFINIGCNKVFRTYQPSIAIFNYLDSILKKKSPLEKIYLCKKILDKINDELNEFLNASFYSPFSKCKHEVLTDDLVAILVYVLIKFNLNNLNKNSATFLVSEFRYIQLFNFYLHLDSSVYDYSITTFEVAINYIKDNYHFKFNESLTKSNSSANIVKCLNSSKSNGSVKSLNKRRMSSKESSKSNESSISDNQIKKPEIRKQLNFTSMKINEDLEKIAKLIEANSFSFQQLENTEKDD